jgi:hypothetical protein
VGTLPVSVLLNVIDSMPQSGGDEALHKWVFRAMEALEPYCTPWEMSCLLEKLTAGRFTEEADTWIP